MVKDSAIAARSSAGMEVDRRPPTSQALRLARCWILCEEKLRAMCDETHIVRQLSEARNRLLEQPGAIKEPMLHRMLQGCSKDAPKTIQKWVQAWSRHGAIMEQEAQ